jgi:hypothetical protein
VAIAVVADGLLGLSLANDTDEAKQNREERNPSGNADTVEDCR